jgi:hypothetical protein
MYARQLLMLAMVLIASGGCTTLHEAPAGEQFSAIPGRYPPAPVGAPKPRVGVPAPQVQVITGADEVDRTIEDAAKQLFWLADHSERFDLVDRVRLAEMISRQGRSGMLRPGALVRQANIDGIDYLLLCSVSNLSVAGAPPPDKASVAGVENMLHIAKPKPKITVGCRVELRLVDPASGTSSAAVEDDYARTGSPEGLGLSFATPEAATGQLRLDDEQIGRVLCLAIDDAMRKILPDIDDAFAQFHPPPTLATSGPSATQPTSSGATTAPALAKIRCPACGFECSPYDEFCPNCGTRLPDNPLRGKREP